jgi:hypothetical protein
MLKHRGKISMVLADLKYGTKRKDQENVETLISKSFPVHMFRVGGKQFTGMHPIPTLGKCGPGRISMIVGQSSVWDLLKGLQS